MRNSAVRIKKESEDKTSIFNTTPNCVNLKKGKMSNGITLSTTPTTSAAMRNSDTKSSSSAQQPIPSQFIEHTLAFFNRAQFFFDPPNIRQQARMDRRFLQRLHREGSHACVRSFFPIDCEEPDLQKHFQALYKHLLSTVNDSARLYQLILNTLTYYFSRRTWSTSVPKCVFESLETFLLKEFHKNLEAKTMVELETVCLLELFIVRYCAGNSFGASEENIYLILARIRQRAGGVQQLASFVNNTVINHFGCSNEPLLRRVCERLDVKVKSYRSNAFESGIGKRKFSQNSLSQGCGSSEQNRSSSEDKTGRESSEEADIVGGIEKEEPEDEEEDERTPSPPASKVAKRSTSKKSSGSKQKQMAQKKSQISGIAVAKAKETPRKATSSKSPTKSPASRSSPRGKGNSETPKKKSTQSSPRTQKAKPKSTGGISRVSPNGDGFGVYIVFKSASELLSPEVLAKYRQRMNAVKRQRCGDEIFYGRSSMRRGLFERNSHSPPMQPAESPTKSTTTSKPNQQKQKSRSGRVITKPTQNAAQNSAECVHIAHLLLNVHNPNPLAPQQLGPPKRRSGVRKLLKPAGKSARKKMDRLLRRRAQKQQQAQQAVLALAGGEKLKVDGKEEKADLVEMMNGC